MIELMVQKMSCGHCVRAVTQAVQALDGNATVNVDLSQGKVSVKSVATRDAIVAAIVDAGYPVAASTAE